MSGIDIILSEPKLRRFFFATSISRFATSLSLVVLMARYYELFGSAKGWGLLALVRALPFVLLGLVAGHIVDRYNRKQILWVSDFGRLVIFVLLALTSNNQLFFAFVFLVSSFAVFYEPNVRSLVVSLVAKEKIVAFNAINETVKSIVSILGIAMSAVLIPLLGTEKSLFITSGFYLFSLVLFFTLKDLDNRVILQSVKIPALSAASIKEAWSIFLSPLIQVPFLAWTLLIFLIGFESPIFFPLVEQKLWGAATQVGYILASISLGSLITSLVLIRVSSSKDFLGRWLPWVIFLDALPIICIAITPHYYVGLLCATMLGVTETILITGSVSQIQKNIDEQTAGRVFTIISSIQEPIKLFGMFLSTTLSLTLSSSSVMGVAGLLELTIAVVLFLMLFLARKK